MIIFSKLLNLFAQPLNGVAVLLVASLYFGGRRPAIARPLFIAGLILLILSGVTTLPDALITQLEGQYPEIKEDTHLSEYAGIVVLGGAMESGRVSAAYQHALLIGSAERLTESFAVWRRNPALRIIFTGGEGELFGTGPSESERAHHFFNSMGLTDSALTLEDKSQNTYENAAFTHELPGVDPKQRWLLVTSAWHMPRAMGVFQKAGWNVTAYPVDFRTAGLTPLTQYSLRDGPERWELALHEYIGLAVYRITGRL